MSICLYAKVYNCISFSWRRDMWNCVCAMWRCKGHGLTWWKDTNIRERKINGCCLNNSNDVKKGLYGVFCKKLVCHFYMTIPVIWSSLDHSKDNSKGGSNKNFVNRRLRWFVIFFIWFLVLPSHSGVIFVISIAYVYSHINLQEEFCIWMDSFFNDGIIVEPRVVLPDTS